MEAENIHTEIRPNMPFVKREVAKFPFIMRRRREREGERGEGGREGGRENESWTQPT